MKSLANHAPGGGGSAWADVSVEKEKNYIFWELRLNITVPHVDFVLNAAIACSFVLKSLIAKRPLSG